jgi:hypothetical protein
VNRVLVRLAERAFYRWLEDVCLDESNGAFEMENSPFASREAEVRAAISREHVGRVRRGRELAPYLQRLGNRDVVRLLGKLETWVPAPVRHPPRRRDDPARRQRREGGSSTPTRSCRATTRPPTLRRSRSSRARSWRPAFWYDSAPRWFDYLCAFEVACANLVIAFFLLYRFLWQRDLTFFHAAVPRIMAGIIVGYLPIFFVDEVWSLSAQPWPYSSRSSRSWASRRCSTCSSRSSADSPTAAWHSSAPARSSCSGCSRRPESG